MTELLKKARAISPVEVVDPMGGSVKKSIVNALNQKNPDLCVIGSTDGGLRSIFSTVQYVLKHAPCDVLVVRDENLASLTSEPMKALVCFGINDWEGSVEAFKATLRVARPGDHIEAVHVVYAGGSVDAVFGPPMVVPPGNGTTGEKIERALEQAMIDVLDDESTCLNREDVAIKPTVLFAGMDNPVKVLMDYAEQQQSNLLSVGVGSVGRVLSPVNFSYQLTRKSPCSVLVARRRAAHCEEIQTSSVSEDKGYYVEDPQEWVRTKSFI